MGRQTLYISLDIEADGPYPLEYSMLSFGMVAVDSTGKEYGTFERNLYELEGASKHPDTMKFWDRFPRAYAQTRVNLVFPDHAMKQNKEWLFDLIERYDCHTVYMGYPLTYDFMWHYTYMCKFTGDGDPLSWSGYDIKTAAAKTLDIPFKWANKRNFPRRWFKGAPAHDHTALTDAREQAILGVNVMKEEPKWRSQKTSQT